MHIMPPLKIIVALAIEAITHFLYRALQTLLLFVYTTLAGGRTACVMLLNCEKVVVVSALANATTDMSPQHFTVDVTAELQRMILSNTLTFKNIKSIARGEYKSMLIAFRDLTSDTPNRINVFTLDLDGMACLFCGSLTDMYETTTGGPSATHGFDVDLPPLQPTGAATDR